MKELLWLLLLLYEAINFSSVVGVVAAVFAVNAIRVVTPKFTLVLTSEAPGAAAIVAACCACCAYCAYPWN